MLGLTYQKWLEKIQAEVKNLRHQDLEVLAIEVLDTTKGEIIESKINNLAKTVGKPIQIISDHGRDIKKRMRPRVGARRKGSAPSRNRTLYN